MQSGCDLVTPSEGQTADVSSDRLEDRQPAELAESSDKLRSRKPVAAEVKPSGRRPTTAGDRNGPRSGRRLCDDCRAGNTRRTSTAGRDVTQRWNFPASSQQPAARIQRTARSTVRQSQDQTVRARSNFSVDEKKRTGGASDPANHCRQRTVPDKQPNRTIENDISESAAASGGRRDVTSGHVTRRSLSAKTAPPAWTSAPEVRRCQSSDDRRQRQKNVVETSDRELTQAPFRRKCCCATRTSQGQGQGRYQRDFLTAVKLTDASLTFRCDVVTFTVTLKSSSLVLVLSRSRSKSTRHT